MYFFILDICKIKWQFNCTYVGYIDWESPWSVCPTIPQFTLLGCPGLGVGTPGGTTSGPGPGALGLLPRVTEHASDHVEMEFPRKLHGLPRSIYRITLCVIMTSSN